MWGMHSQNYDVDNSDFFLDKKKKIHSNVDKKKRPDTSPVLCLHSEGTFYKSLFEWEKLKNGEKCKKDCCKMPKKCI